MCTPEQCENLYDSTDKWRVSILAGLIFMVIASPISYSILNAITSQVGIIMSVSGSPTFMGLVITGIIYALVTRAIMH